MNTLRFRAGQLIFIGVLLLLLSGSQGLGTVGTHVGVLEACAEEFEIQAPELSGDPILDTVSQEAEARTVHADIQPGTCPNTVNAKAQGNLPVSVQGGTGFDVSSIDPATVRLTCKGCEKSVSPLRWSYEDVSAPSDGELCECRELGPDGYADLSLKFDIQEVKASLDLEDKEGDILPLLVTGNLFDGTPIQGSDCAWIEPLPESLPMLGYWSFNETLEDWSGHGNHGRLREGHQPTWVEGISESGLQLGGGTDEVVIVPHRDVLDPTERIKIDFWMYPQAIKQSMLISKSRGWDAANRKWASLSYIVETDSYGHVLFILNLDNVTYFVRSESTAPINTWTHVVGAYDSVKMTLHLNGVLEDVTYPLLKKITGAGANLTFGAAIYGDCSALYRFEGIIDEVKISVPAAPEEIGYQPPDLASDIVLLYGSYKTQLWTPERLQYYVTRLDDDGNPDSALFDGFLFTALIAPSGRGFLYSVGEGPSTKEDWEWYQSHLYEAGANLDALDSVVASNSAVLGTGYKAKVIIAIPYPDPSQASFGSVGGVELNFANLDHRVIAANWWIDEITAGFAFDHLDLLGFYWLGESMYFPEDEDLVREVNQAIHNRGLKSFWIPHYGANGFPIWRELGFDSAMLQISAYINGNQPDDSHLEDVAKLARLFGSGMEMVIGPCRKGHCECDVIPYSDPFQIAKFRRWIEEGSRLGYRDETILSYFQDLQDVRLLYLDNREFYHKLCDFIQGR